MDRHRTKRIFCENCNTSISRTYFKSHLCASASSTNIYVQPAAKKKVIDYQEINAISPMEIHVETPATASDNETDEASSNDDDNFLLTESDSDVDIDELVTNPEEESSTIQLLITYFVLKWQSIFKISNAAIQCLLIFLNLLLKLITNLKVTVPSYYLLRKSICNSATHIKKYVACGKCYKLYDIEDCSHTVEGKEVTKRCKCVLFPNHSQLARRKPCNEELMTAVKLPSGKIKLKPKFEYCYHSVKNGLQSIMLRPTTKKMLSSWLTREVDLDTLEDIYDGQVWQELKHSGYFSNANNLCVLLNIDWFQPFERISYSVGVIYLEILNLPRNERLKKENILVVGVIPHFGREPTSVNSFLEPLVEELNEAYHSGFELFTAESPVEKEKFRVQLICVACDLPAVRKVCGFLGHGAKLGCSKCYHEFEFDENGNQCCGNFENIQMKPRTNSTHRSRVAYIQKHGITPTIKKEMEMKLGVRYSQLLNLKYLDITRCHVVDALHNLMLGSAKRLTMHWINTKLLTNKQLDDIEDEITKFVVPSGIGRLPKNISTGMASFTADQWRHWTEIYSLVVLKNKLDNKHYKVWQLFVNAFTLVCRPIITKGQVLKSNQLFKEFGIACENLYGKPFITPNMHMHLHLHQTIIDFGPVYATWCFAMERMNGLMGRQPHNNKHLEEQILQKLLVEMHLCGGNNELTTLLQNDKYFQVVSYINSSFGTKNIGGGEADVMKSDYTYNSISKLSSQSLDVTKVDFSLPGIDLHKGQRVSLEKDIANLEKMYQYIYNGKKVDVNFCAFQHKRMRVGNLVFGSRQSGSHSLSNVMAYWSSNNNNDIITTELRAGQIIALYTHHATINGRTVVHGLAKVNWFPKLDDKMRLHFGIPVQVFSANVVDDSPFSWIPVNRLKCQFASTVRRLNGSAKVVACPLH